MNNAGALVKMIFDGKRIENPIFFVHYGGNAQSSPDWVDFRRKMNYDGSNSTVSADIFSDEWPESLYRDACRSHDYWYYVGELSPFSHP